MDKQMKKEEELGIGGPTIPPQEQVDQQQMAEQYPPEDNTAENGANESKTPQLDADVEKYASLLNRR